MAELSDAEVQAIADGDHAEQAEVAAAIMAERDETFGGETAASSNGNGEGGKAKGKAAELKKEGGEPVGKMPDKEPEKTEPEVDEIVLDGSTQLELFDVGGKKATRATIKFTGGKVKLSAGKGFKKGERIKFTGEAIVNEVGQKDEHDPQTSQVVDCEQRHSARIVDLSVDRAG